MPRLRPVRRTGRPPALDLTDILYQFDREYTSLV
jgi:hypothetical protein